MRGLKRPGAALAAPARSTVAWPAVAAFTHGLAFFQRRGRGVCRGAGTVALDRRPNVPARRCSDAVGLLPHYFARGAPSATTLLPHSLAPCTAQGGPGSSGSSPPAKPMADPSSRPWAAVPIASQRSWIADAPRRWYFRDIAPPPMPKICSKEAPPWTWQTSIFNPPSIVPKNIYLDCPASFRCGVLLVLCASPPSRSLPSSRLVCSGCEPATAECFQNFYHLRLFD